MYCTEFGVMTNGAHYHGEKDGADNWARALSIARRYHVAEVVAWQILQTTTTGWDTSLVRPDGTQRPAFAAILANR